MQLTVAQQEAARARSELDREVSARQTLQLQLENKEQLIAGLRAQLETKTLQQQLPLPNTADLSFVGSRLCSPTKDTLTVAILSQLRYNLHLRSLLRNSIRHREN